MSALIQLCDCELEYFRRADGYIIGENQDYRLFVLIAWVTKIPSHSLILWQKPDVDHLRQFT